MKKCVKCNTPIEPGETKCSYCGLEVKVGEAQRKIERANRRLHPSASTGGRGNGLQQASKVLLIITCVMSGFVIISSLISVIIIASSSFTSELGLMLLQSIGLMIGGIVALGISIPVTVHYVRNINSGSNVDLAFKICCLVFVNRIAGILMLCDTSN